MGNDIDVNILLLLYECSSIEARSYDQGSIRALWPIYATFRASEARYVTWRNCVPLLLDYTILHGCRLGLYPLLSAISYTYLAHLHWNPRALFDKSFRNLYHFPRTSLQRQLHDMLVLITDLQAMRDKCLLDMNYHLDFFHVVKSGQGHTWYHCSSLGSSHAIDAKMRLTTNKTCLCALYSVKLVGWCCGIVKSLRCMCRTVRKLLLHFE